MQRETERIMTLLFSRSSRDRTVSRCSRFPRRTGISQVPQVLFEQVDIILQPSAFRIVKSLIRRDFEFSLTAVHSYTELIVGQEVSG